MPEPDLPLSDLNMRTGLGSLAPDSILSLEAVDKAFVRRRSIRQILSTRKRQVIHALDKVSFEVRPGEVLGLAGESGSGKTVTGELIAALQGYDGGSIRFEGQELASQTREQRREFRRRVSMVFQDPYQSLNPRMTVLDSVVEPLRVHKLGTRQEQEIAGLEVLDRVGLRPADHFANEYPHQLSGGERQRAAVARALITKPKLLIADEPTTMLDVSVRTGLLNLLRDITREEGLAMVFISHDFTTLEYLCDRIVIIYLGRVAEIGPATDVLQNGLHPYAQVLAAAIPVADPEAHRQRVRSTIDTGEPAREGCLFEPRCPHRMDICVSVIPPLDEAQPGRFVACHLYSDTTNEK
jgi:peptide/nickel transport system ATP-binding protein